ncbi:hypothetical protein ACFLS9_00315 [Bacteroidota bacterium]
MKQIKPVYYLLPFLLAVLIFASNFLSTELFKVGVQNFTVWFVLSIFSFACGWLIDKTLGWIHGGKVVFSVIVTAVFISVLMISLFQNYFGINNLLTENLILYSLRNIVLGAMGLFGMVVAEMLHIQKEISNQINKNVDTLKIEEEARKKAELLLNEAKIKAERLLFEAERKSVNLEEKRKNLENRLREFIQIERELINKYEVEENTSDKPD